MDSQARLFDLALDLGHYRPPKPRILVFASGTEDGGGSGFQEMVEQSRLDPPILNAEIVGVVSNHPHGGVFQKAKKLGVEFEHFTRPFSGARYRDLLAVFQPDFVMLSGWLRVVHGLTPAKTVNIHPGPLPLTAGLYGHHVHEAVIAAFRKGEVKQSAVTIHFVTEEVDKGPIICHYPVQIREDDDAESLGKRVNAREHAIQSHVLNLVVHGEYVLHNGKVHRSYQMETVI